MTKKDYKLIAEAICYTRSVYDYREQHEVISKVASDIADNLQKDNPRFDRNKFLEACQN